MAQVKERRLLVIIFKNFLKSITPKIPKHSLVGQDYNGTKYFEIEKTDSIHNKPNRYFVPRQKDDFSQDLPAEWESWLRNRRKLPPTEEEVNASYEMILTKKKNAALIEAKYAKETTTLDIVDPDAKPLDQHASIGFPVYEEYVRHGQAYKPQIKK